MSPQPNPEEDIFAQSSSIADHETALNECNTEEELRKAWDDCTKDSRLTSETRSGLYAKFQKMAKGMKGKK